MIFLNHILLLILIILSSTASSVTTLDLPDIGDSTGSILSPEFERRLGQAFLSQVRKQANIITDPEVETYIQSIGYRLVSHSDNNTQAFTFFVINDRSINAFAAPGGIVGINSGVILNASTESELAGVMAHEITHVTQKHMARSFEMQSKMSLPMMAAMLGAILIATQNPEAGQAALLAVQGGAVQAQINFTRGNEAEADRIGMQLLSRAGFNPRGMPGFFEKLQKNSRYASQAPEFLRTHPLTVNRIADARSRSESYPLDKKYQESINFEFIRSKLIVMAYKNPRDAVDFFQQKLETERFGDNFAALRYGYALALMEAGDYRQAGEYLRALLAQDKENISYMLATADLETRQGKYQQAFQIYEQAENIYPDYRPVILSYSKALLEARLPNRAIELLQKYGKFREPDLTYYEYLARAEAEAGNKVESSIAHSGWYYLSGETRVAIEQLRHVLRQRNPKPDYYQQERILARMDFLEQELQIEIDFKLVK
ncbi:MAG: M48 family metalloprotease [Gammaproteobacteria bacterium]|nr:M48 family metalloprotease [Gammaproteobacteria bacterium]